MTSRPYVTEFKLVLNLNMIVYKFKTLMRPMRLQHMEYMLSKFLDHGLLRKKKKKEAGWGGGGVCAEI